MGKRLGYFIGQYRNTYFKPDKMNGPIVYSYKPLPNAENAIYEKISDITVSMKANEYLKMPYRMEVVEDPEEGGFVVSYPDLPGCITCGETMESAIANAKDAQKAWLEAALEDGIKIPEPDSLSDYSGQFKLRIPRSLHRSLAEHSQREGISMNQYCVYLLSKNDAVYSK